MQNNCQGHAGTGVQRFIAGILWKRSIGKNGWL